MTVPNNFARHFKETVTYWAPAGNDGYGGRVVSAPVQQAARWEQRAEQFHTQTGEVDVSNAVVFLSGDVEVGGFLYLGTSVATDPNTVAGAFIIRQFTSFPDLRNLNKERKAFL